MRNNKLKQRIWDVGTDASQMFESLIIRKKGWAFLNNKILGLSPSSEIICIFLFIMCIGKIYYWYKMICCAMTEIFLHFNIKYIPLNDNVGLISTLAGNPRLCLSFVHEDIVLVVMNLLRITVLSDKPIPRRINQFQEAWHGNSPWCTSPLRMLSRVHKHTKNS
jgi:hypothetical protein